MISSINPAEPLLRIEIAAVLTDTLSLQILPVTPTRCPQLPPSGSSIAARPSRVLNRAFVASKLCELLTVVTRRKRTALNDLCARNTAQVFRSTQVLGYVAVMV
eukprot:IDg15585t1